MLRHDADQGHTYNNLNWASHIKSFLDQLGFSNVWLDQDDLTCIPLPQIRQRLFDQCNQSIITAANGSQKLILYNQYKTECKLEPYLDLVCENKYRIALSRFRLSSHRLMTEIGRYNGTPREDRICLFCNMRKKRTNIIFASMPLLH